MKESNMAAPSPVTLTCGGLQIPYQTKVTCGSALETAVHVSSAKLPYFWPGLYINEDAITIVS
jgi:hypothetical protein